MFVSSCRSKFVFTYERGSEPRLRYCGQYIFIGRMSLSIVYATTLTENRKTQVGAGK